MLSWYLQEGIEAPWVSKIPQVPPSKAVIWSLERNSHLCWPLSKANISPHYHPWIPFLPKQDKQKKYTSLEIAFQIYTKAHVVKGIMTGEKCYSVNISDFYTTHTLLSSRVIDSHTSQKMLDLFSINIRKINHDCCSFSLVEVSLLTHSSASNIQLCYKFRPDTPY